MIANAKIPIGPLNLVHIIAAPKIIANGRIVH